MAATTQVRLLVWTLRGLFPARTRQPRDATPAIAQLAEHLTVDMRSDQMVPGSIPGGRTCIVACLLGRSPRKNCKNDLDGQT